MILIATFSDDCNYANNDGHSDGMKMRASVKVTVAKERSSREHPEDADQSQDAKDNRFEDECLRISKHGMVMSGA